MNNKVNVIYSKDDLMVSMEINNKKIDLFMCSTYFSIKKNGKKFVEAFGEITDDEKGFDFVDKKVPKINTFLFITLVGFATWKAIKHQSWLMLVTNVFNNNQVKEESSRNLEMLKKSSERIQDILGDFMRLNVEWKEKDP